MNIDLIRAKLDCAIHRAKLRGLRPDSVTYSTVAENGRWRHKGHRYFLLDMIIEEHKHVTYSRYPTITKVLSISHAEATALEYGICGSRRYNYSVIATHNTEAMNKLGLEFHRKLFG